MALWGQAFYTNFYGLAPPKKRKRDRPMFARTALPPWVSCLALATLVSAGVNMGLALPAPAYNAQQWHRHQAATKPPPRHQVATKPLPMRCPSATCHHFFYFFEKFRRFTLHRHTTPHGKPLPQPVAAAPKAPTGPIAMAASVTPLEELPLEAVLNQRYTPESGQEPNSPFKQATQALAATLFVAAAAWAILRHPRTHKVLLWVGQLLAQWGFKVQVPPTTPVVAAPPAPTYLTFTPFTPPAPAEAAKEDTPAPPAQWEPPTPNPAVTTPVATATVTPAEVETVLPPAPITPFSATGPSFRVLASQALPLNGFLHQVQVEDTLLLVAQSAQGFTLLHHQPLHSPPAAPLEAEATAPRLLANPMAAIAHSSVLEATGPADEDDASALSDDDAEEAIPCPSQEASAFWEAVAGR